MATCSVCSNSELAETVNQLLFEKKATLQEIADLVGSTKSSIGRHSAKCFLQWKAARIKTRKGSSAGSGRTIVKWAPGPESAFPDGAFFALAVDSRGRTVNQALSPSDVTEADDVFLVEYAAPLPPEPASSAENETPNCPVQ